MSRYADWKTGISLSYSRRFDAEFLKEVKAAGIDCVELSFSKADYLGRIGILSDPIRIRRMAADAGLELWSIHLPFGNDNDISTEDDVVLKTTRMLNRRLIEAAAVAGVRTVVIHPASGIPASDEERARRMLICRDSLRYFRGICGDLGMTLAVENLSHTLLRWSAEARQLLEEVPGLRLTYDTNHLIVQPNAHYLAAVGESIATIHVSDYDFVKERHLLPLRGRNDWKTIIRGLEKADYQGPWMYEVPARDDVALADFAANRAALGALLTEDNDAV